MDSYDLIVLGMGGVGSAALYHAARRGVRVLGLDRFPAGHDRGSSHGETRIIRQAYFEHPDYVPLLLRAYELWRELELRAGRQLYFEVGLLQVGPPDACVVPGVLRSAHDYRLEVEPLTSQEAMRRFPMFQIPAEHTAVFERRAGYLHVEECVRSHLAAARQSGADQIFDATIQGWEPRNSEFVVHTSRGSFQARHLIVSAGPWAGTLLRALAERLQVLRKHLHWFEPADRRYHWENGCPTFLFESDRGVFYGFPQIGAGGVKVAEHSGGVCTLDPLNDPRHLDPLDRQRVQQFVAEAMPGVTLRALRHAVCFYTMSPDAHFIVDRDAEHPRVVYAAGLSGHGFKFAPVLGQALTEMTLDGGTALPVAFLATRDSAASHARGSENA
ncbi:MAG: N-methyl-L-tryptophan oxidase [Planctomycetes bacterium]|nr:N-methyl-L-tryptophan oxidase [Planctomycetota bacterium]